MFPHPLLFPPMCVAKRSFNSSFLLLSLLWGKDQGCKWLFSPMGGSMANPEPHSLGKGDRHAHKAQTPLMAVNQSHNCWAIFIESLVSGELPIFHMRGKDSHPKLAAWSTEMCCPALCPASWGARQLQEALWCQQLPLCRRVGSERRHPSAASCCFILPILHHTLSYAPQHF